MKYKMLDGKAYALWVNIKLTRDKSYDGLTYWVYYESFERNL